jgi:hypothetical protein
MKRHSSIPLRSIVVGVAALAAIAWLALHSEAQAGQRSSVKSTLHATTADPGAEGDVEENVEDPPTVGTIACCLNTADQQGCSDLTAADCTAAGGVDAGTGTCDPDPCGDSQGGDTCPNQSGEVGNLRGGLSVSAGGLPPHAMFTVTVGGVPVGAFKTNVRGRGRKRFRARKLTVDPRGRRIAVTNAAGTELLGGTTADPTTPCGVACCLDNADEQGCEDLAAADCTAAGGVDAGTGTCDPDPCPGQEGSNPPGSIACCLNSADQQGCEDLLPADCTAAGGVDAGTGTCDPDPCPGAPD